MTGKKLGAAAIIFDEAGRVLLVKHSYGRRNWELPGGAAEANETIVETARREVREETGLDVVAEATTGVYAEPAEDMLHFAFLCRRLQLDAEPRVVSDETTDCGFWDPADLPRPIHSMTVRRIQDAVKGARYPLPTIVGPREWLD